MSTHPPELVETRYRNPRTTDLPPELAKQLRRAIRGALEAQMREHGTDATAARWPESAVKRVYGSMKTVLWNVNGQGAGSL